MMLPMNHLEELIQLIGTVAAGKASFAGEIGRRGRPAPTHASLVPANDRPYTDLLNSTVGPSLGADCRVFLSL
tara:strand:- start:11 stop:229 length:219 start_codon:yes stop_codon:yes gene_type:complete